MVFYKLSVVFAVIATIHAEDYCDPSLCKFGASHIGCKNSNNFGPVCSVDAEVIPMLGTRKTAIVKVHNTKRNLVASGKLAGLPKASRMPQLQWDNELANLAEMTAKNCDNQHDACHNTKTFKQSGQNMALTMNNHKDWDADKEIEKVLNSWFDQSKRTTASDIEAFAENNGTSNLEFLTMVNDRITKLGCAMVRFTSKEDVHLKEFLLVCNYSFTNVANEPVYKTGDAALEYQKQTTKAPSKAVAMAYRKLFNLLHKHNFLPAFVEKLFVACETLKSPLAESYWLQVVVNSLLKHANRGSTIKTSIRDHLDLDQNIAPVEFSIDFVGDRISGINRFTKDAALMCMKLMNPPTSDEKLAAVEKLVSIYSDPAGLKVTMNSHDDVYTVRNFLEKMQTRLTQMASPVPLKVGGTKRKFGAWQLDDENFQIDWKKIPLGCEISG